MVRRVGMTNNERANLPLLEIVWKWYVQAGFRSFRKFVNVKPVKLLDFFYSFNLRLSSKDIFTRGVETIYLIATVFLIFFEVVAIVNFLIAYQNIYIKVVYYSLSYLYDRVHVGDSSL